MRSRTRVVRSPDRAIRELEQIAKRMSGPKTVKIGLPKGSNAYPDGTSVIMVGAVHEFGSPSRGIPQRSFLRATLQDHRAEYKVMFRKLSLKMVEGSMDMKKALGLIGLTVQGQVIARMSDGIEPPLTSREGTPLIDTGHLRQSITYEVQE